MPRIIPKRPTLAYNLCDLMHMRLFTMSSPMNLLTHRRSVLAKNMVEPGPSQYELQSILQAAHRVPDHGKIGPWRFVIFKDDARKQFGDKLAEIYKKSNPDSSEKALQFQAESLMRAPLVIAVISTASEHKKVPQWEQALSAGASCQNILLAASALGYAAQWLTEWYSYSEEVNTLLNMESHHQIAGFLYIGSFSEPPSERDRPSLDDRTQYWPLEE